MDKNRINFIMILKICIYAMILYGLYKTTVLFLFHQWRNENFSYGYLIPFIGLYLFWEKKEFFLTQKSKPQWLGFLGLILGLFFFWMGELGGEYFILYLSLWLILVSLCIINMGLEKVKIIFFSLFFILTMFPPPAFINGRITLSLKLISTKIGVLLMQAYGMSVFREGNVIDLGFTKLQVVDACSGLRYLFPMIVLSILIAYYYKSKIWKRLIIVFSSVPLTIFSNSLRIALTGILSEKFGSVAVEGFFHDFEGIMIFMLTLVVMLLEIWVLKKLFPEHRHTAEDAEDRKEEVDDVPEKVKSVSFLRTPQFIISVILLCATLGFSYGIEFREIVPMNQSFNKFPMKIGKWVGTLQMMEDKFIDTLDFTDYVMADYRDNSGKTVNFYVAYYASQRKGESIHSPATCLRGGGWKFKEAGGSLMELKDKTKLPFNRAVIEKEPVQQISYYWFPSRDRVLTNAYQLKWFNFWDALTRQRTDGALVRVITLVYPDEDVQMAEGRMKEFIRDMVPVLSEFLPK